jgi:hypothetical protein
MAPVTGISPILFERYNGYGGTFDDAVRKQLLTFDCVAEVVVLDEPGVGQRVIARNLAAGEAS